MQIAACTAELGGHSWDRAQAYTLATLVYLRRDSPMHYPKAVVDGWLRYQLTAHVSKKLKKMRLRNEGIDINIRSATNNKHLKVSYRHRAQSLPWGLASWRPRLPEKNRTRYDYKNFKYVFE